MSAIKSRKVRQLQGTDRKDRPAAEDRPGDMPLPEKPPSWLSQAAANHWHRLRPELAGIATSRDADTLAIYCDDLAAYLKASAQARKLTDMIEVSSQGNERPSAVFEIKNKLSSRLAKNARALGLTPESRGIKRPEPKGETPANEWDSI